MHTLCHSLLVVDGERAMNNGYFAVVEFEYGNVAGADGTGGVVKKKKVAAVKHWLHASTKTRPAGQLVSRSANQLLAN